MQHTPHARIHFARSRPRGLSPFSLTQGVKAKAYDQPICDRLVIPLSEVPDGFLVVALLVVAVSNCLVELIECLLHHVAKIRGTQSHSQASIQHCRNSAFALKLIEFHQEFFEPILLVHGKPRTHWCSTANTWYESHEWLTHRTLLSLRNAPDRTLG